MKPTPKGFASRLAPWRNRLTHSLPLFRPSAFPSMSHCFPLAPFRRVCHDTVPWLISFSLKRLDAPEDTNVMICSALWHRIRQPRYVVPRVWHTAGAVVTRRVGVFAMA